MFKIGDKVIWTRRDNNDVTKIVLVSGVVTKVGKETVWIDNQHKPEDQVYAAFLWPDNEECRHVLEEEILLNRRHKEEQDEHIKQVYKLNNKLINQGLK